MVFEGIRSQGIDPETRRLKGLRGQGRSGETTADGLAQRQRRSGSRGDADHEPVEAVTWALDRLELGLDHATISTE